MTRGPAPGEQGAHRTPLRYQPFYCEENVWHLCREPLFAGRPRAAVFISNRERTCAMWHQRAARLPGTPMVWDYHVVLLAGDPWEVWDLDTTLGLPVPAEAYLLASFNPHVPRPFRPRFRVVEAGRFGEVFASDRSHMRRADGRFRKPPPPWPAIGPEGGASNLMRFVDLEDPIAGEVLDLGDLLARVSGA
jgi:hypothetical protein